MGIIARAEVGNVPARFARASRAPGRVLDSEMRSLGDTSAVIFRGFALHDSGRLRRGIRRGGKGGAVTVTAEARNPTSGYDYVGVTRFGHKVERITPRADRAPASVIRGRKARATGGAAALKTPFGFFRSVRGFKPASDWAEDALPAVFRAIGETERRIGRRITAEF